jgi:glycosyltransferase involved in cell wall biosynthesis
VHPSRLDATPYAIIEALATGLPVVASRIYGIPELVEDGVSGLLVPAGAPGALASAVQVLVDDPERLGRIGRAARRRYEAAFTLERCVGRMTGVYEELLGGGGRRL